MRAGSTSAARLRSQNLRFVHVVMLLGCAKFYVLVCCSYAELHVLYISMHECMHYIWRHRPTLPLFLDLLFALYIYSEILLLILR